MTLGKYLQNGLWAKLITKFRGQLKVTPWAYIWSRLEINSNSRGKQSLMGQLMDEYHEVEE